MDEDFMKALINEHWGYIENLLRATLPDTDQMYSREEVIDLVGFHYKSSGQHFWKHAYEHMGKIDV